MKAFNYLHATHYIADDPGSYWRKDPKITIDTDTPLDDIRVLTPNVIRQGDGYRMYYTGYGSAKTGNDVAGYILSAWSDDGLHWVKDVGVRIDVFEPYANFWTLCPDVIPLPDGRWRMYFEARSKDRPTVILSAISTDGLQWQPEPEVRVSNPTWSFGSPRCIYFPNPNDPEHFYYRLYFHHYSYPMRSGLDAKNHIISAISEDGLNFFIEPGVRIAQESAERESYAVYAPEVIRLKDNTYRMYYSGWGNDIRGGIFSAISTDGLNWHKEDVPLLDLDRPLDQLMVSEPCVMDLGQGKCRLYYEAQGADGIYRILSATAFT